MRKIVVICLGTICLIGCQKIFQSILPEKPYTLFLEEEHFTIIPEKSSFKIGDTISIHISFPEHLKSEHGNIEKLKPKSPAFFGNVHYLVSETDSLQMLVDDKPDIYILNLEHNNGKIFFKNDLKLIFKKEGEFKLKRIVPMISINYHQSCTYIGNKTFKVVP